MKSINLFGQEEHVFTNRRKSQKSIFDDYEGFVEKFNPKKTTDDCYTPPAVYDYVLQYVADHCDIDGMTVVRPFYPGGDYESLVYPDNCVVIDKPALFDRLSNCPVLSETRDQVFPVCSASDIVQR